MAKLWGVFRDFYPCYPHPAQPSTPNPAQRGRKPTRTCPAWSSDEEGLLEEGFDRPPFVSERAAHLTGARGLGEAVRVLGLMLQLDDMGEGQRADLLFVREVLARQQEKLAHELERRRGQVAESTVEAILTDGALDETTQAYLLAFGSPHGHRRKKLKDVACAVQMMIRMKHRMNELSAMDGDRARRFSKCHILAVDQLPGLNSWGDFDVFRVARECQGRPLLLVGFGLLEKRGLIESFGFQKPLLSSFLDKIEEQYLGPAYHNAVHAADVAQGAHVLLLRGLERGLRELEVLAVILASICHDVGHRGLTNDFRVRSGDADAITFSDLSVNERMHLALTYRTLQRPECDFLAVPLVPKQRATLRGLVVQMVLATDMNVHFQKLKELQSTVDEKGVDVQKWDSTVPLLQLALHAADLANPCRPRALARRWTDCILEEFFMQGDQERSLGRELSPLCDRSSTSKPGSQIGFISFIVRPTFELLSCLCDTSDMMGHMQSYHDFWQEALAEEKKQAKGPAGRLEGEPPALGPGASAEPPSGGNSADAEEPPTEAGNSGC